MTADIAKKIFTELLEVQEPVDWDTVKYQEVEGWDSLAHMAIVAELEDTLGIMLDTDDIIDMSSFAKSVECAAANGEFFA